MYAEDIFVFTPKGDIRRLSAGSTVLDFAFEIHTEVGCRCTGAKVNGKRVPIRHELTNADMVEISTSKAQNPKRDWLNFVTTNKAKNKIKRALKELEYQQADLGKEILKKKLDQWKLPFTDTLIKKVLQRLGFKDVLQLYQALAENKLESSELKKLIFESETDAKVPSQDKIRETVSADQDKSTKQALMPGSLLIDENPSIRAYQLASCCKPVFGSEVFAFVTVAKGISIHRFNCPNASQMRVRHPYRILPARWIGAELSPQSITLRLKGTDRIGILNQVTDLVSNQLKINLSSLSIHADKGSMKGDIGLEVHDMSQLDTLIHQLLKIPGIEKVFRINN